MGLLLVFSHKKANGVNRRFQTSLRARSVALFFCLLFMVSLVIPTYSSIVLAAPKTPKLPEALPVASSTQTAAVDAQTPKSEKASNADLSGEGLAGPHMKPSKPGGKRVEIASKRTLNTKTFDTGGGRMEVRQYMGPVHFKNSEGKLQHIDTTLVQDTNAADSSNMVGRTLAWAKGKTQDLSTYKVKSNDWQARFAASDDKVGMVRLEADGKKISFTPKDAARAVTPLISKTAEGIELVRYPNLWKDVDVIYTVKNDMLKEEIVLKSAQAETNFAFTVTGANLKPNKDGGFDVEGVKQSFSELSVTLQKAGPTSEKVISQEFKKGILTVKLDKTWLKQQSPDQFPVVIDPTWGRTGNISWNYAAYKSDGYACSSSVCFTNAGTLYDNGWKSWRSVFYVDFNFLQGKQISGACMYLRQANRSYLAGYNGPRYYWMAHATNLGYNSIDGGSPSSVGLVQYDGCIEARDLVQFEINRGDWGAHWTLWGEEWAGYTYKGFDPDLSYMAFNYSTAPATPTVVSPQPEQTFTDPQVSFQVNPVGDPDGDKAQYYFRVATGSDGETGTVVNSGDLDSTQWTVPDGVLQDGTTYYLHAYSRDPYAYSAPSAPIKFKIDMRRGKDKTQTADTVGPVSIDLATGNLSTSISSHDTTALGGNLGVSLDYNSPLRSRNGLVGRYWNNTSLHGNPVLTRVDKDVNFNWDLGSYVAGQPVDNYSASWDGYFVAPVDGSYTFGGSNDDGMTVYVGGAKSVVYGQGCYGGLCWGNSYYMKAGQVVPVQVTYAEATGLAYAKLYVKGPVAEQVVPSTWLQTGVRPLQQNKGLQGRYYANNAGYNLDAPDKSLFLSRVESNMSFNWGTESPIPNGAVDFMSRWEGYITVPKTADYQFTTFADDGTRLSIDGVDLSPPGAWNKCCSETAFTTTRLEAGKQYYIKVDHYDGGGPGHMALYAQTTDGSIPKQVVPTSWLSPTRQVLPDGWQLGIDPDGDLSYERVNVTTSSATLTDSTGDTHMYTWTGSGYKPPVNEDGQLSRNPDGTLTLLDVDGKTYNFEADGQLGKVTMPTDDRKPAALQYSYTAGKITKIADGVDPARNAQVYYYGDGKGKCTSPGGFDSEDWLKTNGKFYVCALETNDARRTEFLYSQGNLSRVFKPGGEAVDYQYDTLGRIVSIRDSLANDAVAAGVRAKDESVLTELTYDNLGRATAVKAPAATSGAARQEQTIDYLPYAMPLVRNIKTTGNVDRWVTTGSVPTGYTPELHISASLLLQQLPGTHALYSCLNGGWDQMVSPDANCEGQQYLGFIGYAYDNPKPDGLTVPIRRCVIGADHFMSHTDNCEGFTTENILGYAIAGNAAYGQTKQHITGDTEPNGFTRRVEYDATFRTVRDTDVSGKETHQQWDSIKDLLLSTTDATGLKSTTIYDANDMPVESYGPAPSNWFGADRKPLAAYTTQVPKTSTAYDEGIKGLAISWFDYTTANGGAFVGAPKLHTTGFNPAQPDRFWLDSTGSPTQFPYSRADTGVQGVGYTATGKFKATTGGNYSFNACYDDAMRIAVNDVVVMNDWGYRGNVVKCTLGTPIYLAPNSSNRIKVEYANATGTYYAFSMDVTGAETINGNFWGDKLKPDYGLQTSQTVYGAPTAVGQTANLVSTTDYGQNPELGLARKVTTDATGPLKLEAKSEYEPLANTAATAPAAEKDRFLRQTSSSLPGGATTRYDYYPTLKSDGTPADPVVNPCDASKSYRQGGMLRLKTEPDPDGTGPQVGRTVETVYDNAGKVAATRYNQDPWTCTTYDSRERVLTTTVPAFGGQPARTIVNDYAVGGNPLITSSGDASGNITVETDLLGRNVRYTDAKQNVTTITYDNSGRLTQRISKLGTETYVYDNYDRLTQQKLDGVTYATIIYDEFSRITNIDYPTGLKLDLTRESSSTGLGRLTKRTYTTATSQTLSDEVTRAVTGDVVSGTELGQAKSYSYDTAGRLVAATVAGNTFTYSYGTQDASCAGKPGVATDLTLAGKDSNRVSQTINGTPTTYCYDQADRLVSSSNALYDGAEYDSHGNTTRLGSGDTATYFTYDSSDRNTGITQTDTTGSITTTYARDVQGRLLYRHQDTNGSNVSNDYYGYTASGDSPDFITDITGTVTQKYISLPGGVRVTIRPDRQSAGVQTFSLPNMHGDIFATIDADGKVLSTHQTGPFGEKLPNQTTPWNTLSGGTMNYVGAALKLTEAQLALQPIQMGARVYIPALGRFLQVDPVQGGTPNNYVYPPEPVNGYDLTGQFWQKILLKLFVREGSKKAVKKEATRQATKQVVRQQVKSSPSTVRSSAPITKTNYQVYTKTNKSTGQTYTGRTSGQGSAQQNILQRNANHHMNSKGFGEPNLMFNTSNKSAARGGEQYWINKFGGAQSSGGTSGNAINGISPNNPRANEYMEAFFKEMGN